MTRCARDLERIVTRAHDLYKRHTQAQLVTMQAALCADPANRLASGVGSIWLYTEKTRRKLNDIAWAIHMHMGDKPKETTVPTYEIWIKNDPALDGRDCQCHIVTRGTLEGREDWSSTLQTTDRELCELNMKRLRRDNPAIADHYEIREVGR